MAPVPRFLERADCGAGRDFLVLTSDKRLMPCSFHDLSIPVSTAEDVLSLWRTAGLLGAPSTIPGCSAGRGRSDDWPECSDDNRPRIAAVGPQVIVHHDYTVSLPPTFAVSASWPSAWRTGSHFLDAPLTVGVMLDDIIDEVSALHVLAEAHGARMHLRLYEAPHEAHDPLAHLSPSTPPP